MNFLAKLFGNREKTETNPTNNVSEIIQTDNTSEMFKNIFIDENPPQTLKEETVKSESLLKNLLDTNYLNKGYNDGYEFHTTATLENFKKRFRAEFRYQVEQILDEKRTEIFRLREELINTEGLSTRMQRLLENRIAEIETVIGRMENEKALSSQDEGLIMMPIHGYTDGFNKGTEQYIIEKRLGESTGLF